MAMTYPRLISIDLINKCHCAILGSGATIAVPSLSSCRHYYPQPPPRRRRSSNIHAVRNSNCTINTANTITQRPQHHLHQRRLTQRTFATQSSSSTFFPSATRSSSIHSLFQHIETKYGNLSTLFDSGDRGKTIIVDDGIIHPHHLVRLMTHEATALHIRNFYNGECAQQLGRELLMHDEQLGGVVGGSSGGGSGAMKNWKINTPRGLESSDVMTVGEHMPYNVAYSSSVAMGNLRKMKEGDGGSLGGTSSSSNNGNTQSISPIDEYFEGVQREFRLRRQPKTIILNGNSSNINDRDYHYYHPLWPLDKLRLELEEAWPSGAGLAREDENNNTTDSASERKVRNQRPYGGGLPRIMQGPTRWKRGFIHVDELGPLDNTRGLFSANIYLTVPETSSSGSIDRSNNDESLKKDAGALYVWPLGLRSRWDWYRNAITLSSLSSQDPEMQHNLRVQLGKPNVIRPEPGDLVLLCAQRPHCAVGFERGVRVSLQCFLSYNGVDKRLLIDC